MFLLALFIDVSEDVVENEVSGRLLGKNEGLAEFLELSRLVGGFANDLDDDVVKRSLGVDVGDTDFAVLEVKFANTFLDSLLPLDRVFAIVQGINLRLGQQRLELPQLQDQTRIGSACHRKANSCQ